FRLPARFLWVASFGACMLTGLGVDAVARPAHRWRVELPVLAVLGAGAFWLVAGSGPIRKPEVWAVAGLACAAALAMRPGERGVPRHRDAGAAARRRGIRALSVARDAVLVRGLGVAPRGGRARVRLPSWTRDARRPFPRHRAPDPNRPRREDRFDLRCAG